MTRVDKMYLLYKCLYVYGLRYFRKSGLFSSPGLKGHVNFCHHFASVVVRRRPSSSSSSSVVVNFSTFQSSPLKPLSRMKPNLAGMLLGWSSTKFVFFRADRNLNMAARANNAFWLAEIWKIFSSKPIGHFNCCFAGMVLGWSCTKFVFFVPIWNPRWPPQPNIV